MPLVVGLILTVVGTLMGYSGQLMEANHNMNQFLTQEKVDKLIYATNTASLNYKRMTNYLKADIDTIMKVISNEMSSDGKKEKELGDSMKEYLNAATKEDMNADFKKFKGLLKEQFGDLALEFSGHISHAMGEAAPFIGFAKSLYSFSGSLKELFKPHFIGEGAESQNLIDFLTRLEVNLRRNFCGFLSDEYLSVSELLQKRDITPHVKTLIRRLLHQIAKGWRCKCQETYLKNKGQIAHQKSEEIIDIALYSGSEGLEGAGLTQANGWEEVQFPALQAIRDSTITKPQASLNPWPENEDAEWHKAYDVKMFVKRRGENIINKDKKAVTELITARHICEDKKEANPAEAENFESTLKSSGLEQAVFKNKVVRFAGTKKPKRDNKVASCHLLSGIADTNVGRDKAWPKVFIFYDKSSSNVPILDIKVRKGVNKETDPKGYTVLPLTTNAREEPGVTDLWNLFGPDYDKYSPYILVKYAPALIKCPFADEDECSRKRKETCEWASTEVVGAYSKGFFVGMSNGLRHRNWHLPEISCEDARSAIKTHVAVLQNLLFSENDKQKWLEGCKNGYLAAVDPYKNRQFCEPLPFFFTPLMPTSDGYRYDCVMERHYTEEMKDWIRETKEMQKKKVK